MIGANKKNLRKEGGIKERIEGERKKVAKRVEEQVKALKHRNCSDSVGTEFETNTKKYPLASFPRYVTPKRVPFQ